MSGLTPLRLLAACAALLLNTAQAAAPAPGYYATPAGQAALTISRSGQQTHFVLEAHSASLNQCDAKGNISADGQARVAGGVVEPCSMRFSTLGQGVKVELDEACQGFCFNNAYLEGEYQALPTLCHYKQINALRDQFKRLYDQKKYQAAVAKLSPALVCEPFLMMENKLRLRNDLALAHLRAGSAAACLQTLRPLQEFAAMSEAQLRQDWPTLRQDDILPLAKATRHNLALCRK